MSETRIEAGRRLASRLLTCIMGLRYVGITWNVKHLQRRLAFLRRMGVHPSRSVGLPAHGAR